MSTETFPTPTTAPTPLPVSEPSPPDAWGISLCRLVNAIHKFLSCSQPPFSLENPEKVPVALDELRAALAECETAAARVGGERERQALSRTLRHVHLEAVRLGQQILEQSASYTPRERLDAWNVADDLQRRLRDRDIGREIEDAASGLAPITHEEPRPRRVGANILVRGHQLELTPQLAELLDLSLEPNTLTFEDARTHFNWDQYDESGIRARVAALNNELKRETKKTPFTILVTTRGKRISAIIRTKAPDTTSANA